MKGGHFLAHETNSANEKKVFFWHHCFVFKVVATSQPSKDTNEIPNFAFIEFFSVA